MKALKFRVWDIRNKKMFDWEEMEIQSRSFLFHELFGELKNYGKVLMEYTGLKDKNGKEIYEGDIVTDDFDRYQIVFEDSSFCGRRPNKIDSSKFILAKIDSRGEVIGNRFQNKDLLK